MAYEKHRIDGGAGKEQPLSPLASEEVPSCMDSNDVITWVKPVGEPRVNSFWRKYFFPL